VPRPRPPLPAPLPRDYYLKNFQHFLEFVFERYELLLTEPELNFRHRFEALSVDGQRLYVRLCARRGPVFRSDTIHYVEIGDILRALDELIATNFAEEIADDVTDWLQLMRKDELLAMLPGPVAHLTKPALVTLVASSMNAARLRHQIRCRMFSLGGLDLLRVYRLLFFGNLQQHLTEFVLNDLGVNAYEDYEIDAGARSVEDREVIDELLAIEDLGLLTDEIIATGDAAALSEIGTLLEVAGCAAGRPRRRLDRLICRVARQLERKARPAEAFSLYDCTSRPPARERRVRILASIGEQNRAVRLCQQMLGKPQDDAEYEFAVRFLRRLLGPEADRHAGLPDLTVHAETESLKLLPVQGVSVESLVCLWAEARGYDGYYIENALFPGLFGLAFWDIIFAPVPDVFFNPFQRGPIDQFDPGFAQLRRELFDQRFRELARPDRLCRIVRHRHTEKFGVSNHFVNWQRLSPELLDQVLKSVPNSHLLAIFHQLLGDLRGRSSGFPDLILFRNGCYRLIEVKGPGDRLQVNQKRWFRFFEREQIPATVVNVEYGVPCKTSESGKGDVTDVNE
jgi:hypothetical protein